MAANKRQAVSQYHIDDIVERSLKKLENKDIDIDQKEGKQILFNAIMTASFNVIDAKLKKNQNSSTNKSAAPTEKTSVSKIINQCTWGRFGGSPTISSPLSRYSQ